MIELCLHKLEDFNLVFCQICVKTFLGWGMKNVCDFAMILQMSFDAPHKYHCMNYSFLGHSPQTSPLICFWKGTQVVRFLSARKFQMSSTLENDSADAIRPFLINMVFMVTAEHTDNPAAPHIYMLEDHNGIHKKY